MSFTDIAVDVTRRFPQYICQNLGVAGVKLSFINGPMQFRFANSRGLLVHADRGPPTRIWATHGFREPIANWLEATTWTPLERQRDGADARQGSRVTYLELTVDAYLRTGATPGHRDLPLAVQALLFASSFRAMATSLKLKCDGSVVTFPPFFEAGKVDAIQALTGFAELSGLRRRPLWSDDHAARIAAHFDGVLLEIFPRRGRKGYVFRRHGAAPDLVPDLIATSLDAINELICKQAHLPALAPRLPSAAIGGPCARGCPTTARNRDGGGGGGTRLYIATAIPV